MGLERRRSPADTIIEAVIAATVISIERAKRNDTKRKIEQELTIMRVKLLYAPEINHVSVPSTSMRYASSWR
jgi:hypothetical protein